MRRNTLILIFMFSALSAAAQKIPDYGLNKVRITAEDKTIQAEIKPVSSEPEPETDRQYYWYSSNHIHFTQGGFSGRLLNGKYIAYYLNKNIEEEGIFDKGLKKGIWKNWDNTGNLMQSYSWKKGWKEGNYSLFDEHGNLKETGRYHNNLLNGKVIAFGSKGQSSTVYYKNGKLTDASPSKFWHAINPVTWWKNYKLHRKLKKQQAK